VLQSLIDTVNRQMEDYHLFNVVSPTLGFIDDLTNWYIRRSRRRFWAARGEDDTDKLAAFATLYEVLTTFAKVLAPVLPFVTERLHQDLVLIDARLEADMAVVRTVVNLGRSLRKHQDLRVRQPLSGVTVVSRDPEVRRAVAAHTDLIAEELNVKRVELDDEEAHIVELSAKANFKVLGPRLGSRTKEVATAIAALDHSSVDRLARGETVDVVGETIGADDVVVRREPRPGHVVETEGLLSVSLDTSLDDALVAEGLAREVVNRLQGLRRDSGLDVVDRIDVRWDTADEALAAAIERNADLIGSEVLASSLTQEPGLAGTDVDVGDTVLTLRFTRTERPVG
jgi:isoleucyl-tRNA synthetase